MNALYIIPILAILILVHEFGHFITARLVGIRVEEFGLGIPPRLFGFRRGGVLYSLNLIPLGGFVRVLGEDGRSFAPDSMQAKSRLQRAAFLAAGSFMNVLLAVVLVTVMVGAQGESRVNVYVAETQPGSPAAEAGWHAGDRFLKVAGRDVTSQDQVVSLTEKYAGQPMPVTLMRAGQIVQTTVTPRQHPPAGSGRVGVLVSGASQARIRVAEVQPGTPAAEAGFKAGDLILAVGNQPIEDASAYTLSVQNSAGQPATVLVQRGAEDVTLTLNVPETSPGSDVRTGMTVQQDVIYHPIVWYQVIPKGLQESWSITTQMFHGLMLLLRGEVSLQSIAGPIGMGQLTSEVLAASAAPTWITLGNIMVLLSLNLAVLNLLPIPALDGGRLLFVLIETIRGKRIPPEKEGLVHFVGLVVLLVFMAVVAFGDVGRLISGESLLR